MKCHPRNKTCRYFVNSAEKKSYVGKDKKESDHADSHDDQAEAVFGQVVFDEEQGQESGGDETCKPHRNGGCPEVSAARPNRLLKTLDHSHRPDLFKVHGGRCKTLLKSG